jgi:hypothetical protein
MLLGLKCLTCDAVAEHGLEYTNMKNITNPNIDSIDWIGNYCTKCFVKKLRGMAMVWNNKLKSTSPNSKSVVGNNNGN